MDLHDAATFFDDDPVYDGYSGEFLFYAQSSSFDDSSSDGSTNRRRILSTGKDIVLPSRRVVTMYGERWIAGTGTTDGFTGEAIRKHYNTKRATDLLTVYTPGKLVDNIDGDQMYGQKMYFKDVVNMRTDTEYDAQWNIFVAPNELVAKGYFVRDGNGRLHRVRNDYLPTEGLRVLQSDELDIDAAQLCIFDTGVEDPITETVVPNLVYVTGIQVDMPKFYRLRYVSDANTQPGDLAVFLPLSLTLKQGMRFEMMAQQWQVLTFQPEMDAQVAHVRLA